jgi:hypothetical protein
MLTIKFTVGVQHIEVMLGGKMHLDAYF